MDPLPGGSGLIVARVDRALAAAADQSTRGATLTLAASSDLLLRALDREQRVRYQAEPGATETGPRPVRVAPMVSPAPSERAPLAMVDAPGRVVRRVSGCAGIALRALDDPRWLRSPLRAPVTTRRFAARSWRWSTPKRSEGPVLLVEIDTWRPKLAQSIGFSVDNCFALQVFDRYDGNPEPWRAVSLFRSNLHVLAINRPCRPAIGCHCGLFHGYV